MTATRENSEAPKESIGVVPTRFSTWGPRTVPRVDYERVFVLDASGTLLGEYVLDDECPLEFSDLKRSMPVSGLRHLVSFYQGDYAFTPFKVDGLWFVVLTRGVPRIEERGYLGTLLAAARIHIPPMLDPSFANRDRELRDRERSLEAREAELGKREQRASEVDAQQRVTEMKLREMEADVRARETKVHAVREYALQMQETFVQGRPKPAGAKKESEAAPEVTVPR